MIDSVEKGVDVGIDDPAAAMVGVNAVKGSRKIGSLDHALEFRLSPTHLWDDAGESASREIGRASCRERV